jgi:hypothetical protein
LQFSPFNLLNASFNAFSATFETFKPKALASLKTSSSILIEVTTDLPIPHPPVEQ